MKKLILVLVSIFCLLAAVYAPGSRPGKKENLTDEFFAAVNTNNTSQIKKLIKKDKRLVWAKKKGMTPFLAAVQKGYPSMVWLLAEYWSRIPETCSAGNALHIAVINRDLNTLRTVVRAAVEDGESTLSLMLNLMWGKQGNTPLHIAAYQCDAQIYDYLISVGANPDKRNVDLVSARTVFAACPAPGKDASK